jgi:hypothetical protein
MLPIEGNRIIEIVVLDNVIGLSLAITDSDTDYAWKSALQL